MKQVVEYKKSPLLRRVAALFIDILVVLLSVLIIDSIATTPIFNAATDYDEMYQELNDTLVESRLYKYDADGFIIIIEDNFDESLKHFYEKYDSLDNYYTLKENSGYFDYDSLTGEWVKKDDALDKDVKIFYMTTAANARNNILLKDENVMHLFTKLEAYNFVMFIINLFVALTIAFLIVPLLSKNGSTVGMKPFYLEVVERKNGENATKLQLLFRYLIVISMYILASYYLFGLPLIVSALMILFTKERLSLCDLLCSNYVVDSGKYEAKIDEKDQILIIYDDGKEEVKKHDCY